MSLTAARAGLAGAEPRRRGSRLRDRRRAIDTSACLRSAPPGEWRGAIAAPRSLRTGRDTLASSGSHCSAASIEQTPVRQHAWLMACDARQPVSKSPLVSAQGLELSARPPRQGQVDEPQGWIESRRTEPPIVVDPATNV